MKKWLSMMLALSVVLSLLAACGQSEEKKDATEASTQQTQPVETESATQPQESLEQGISFNDDAITLVTIGETLSLYNGTVPVAEVSFTTDNPYVATIEDGVVTAVAAGETDVYAQYGDQRISCHVNCNMDAPKPTEATQPPVTEPQPTETKPVETTQPTPSGSAGPRDPSVEAPANQSVDSSFFDDAVFVGDSISLKLSQYAASSGALGRAKFLVIGSFGVNNAVNDHPDTRVTYQGVKYQDIEEAIKATGAKKMFIMFGMNDIGLHGIDKTITNWGVLVGLIRSQCPDIAIYIQSMTPIWTGGEKGKLTNANVLTYNEKLKAFAQSNGCKYIDIHPYMQDSTGGLATIFCSDKYVHLTNEGAQRWIAVLKAYTGY